MSIAVRSILAAFVAPIRDPFRISKQFLCEVVNKGKKKSKG